MKPAAIQAAENTLEPPLPAIISPAEARSLTKLPPKNTLPSFSPAFLPAYRQTTENRTLPAPTRPQLIENTTVPAATAPQMIENPTLPPAGPRLSGAAEDRSAAQRSTEVEVVPAPRPTGPTGTDRTTQIIARPLPLDSGKRLSAAPPDLILNRTPARSESPLPPIVPASAMPRRPAKSRPAIREASGRRAVIEAQFIREEDDGDLFAAQPAQPIPPPAPPAPAPVAPAPVAPPPVEAAEDSAESPLPPGSPFEAVTESGTLTIRVRRSLLMRTKVDIYRTAVVDETICDIVQFTPREISLIGRAQGATHVTFWFDDPAQPPLTYLVKVEPDADAIKRDEYKYQLLEDLVNEMFPDSKVRLVVLADKLLVKGQARDSEEAAQIMAIIRTQGQSPAGGNGVLAGGGLIGAVLPGVGDTAATGVIPASAAGALAGQPAYQVINMLRVPGVQQVALRVKIAELNRSAARGFGVNVETNIDFGDAVNGSKLLLTSLLNTQAGGGTSVIADISGDDASLGIRYLQQHGVIRLLSEPTLVTLSGKPATFAAGGEFAVPTVVGAVGLNAVTTDFRAFGAIISFLPTVVDKDRIRLQVAPEFSQINSDLTVGGTPGLNVRSATTTVEMREGQTLAIAGLLEDNFQASTVGDLPFLAKVFGRRDASRNETELIILVTPELVHPMEPEEVPPLPGFDVTEPTNAEFFLHGHLEGHPTREYRSTVWPRLKKRYGGPAMTSGPFGHGQ